MKKIVLIATILFLAMSSYSVASDSFRCNGNIIEIGKYKSDIINSCSNSSIVAKKTKVIDWYGDPLCVEIWTIDLGSNSFIRFVYFECGEDIIIKIKESSVKW